MTFKYILRNSCLIIGIPYILRNSVLLNIGGEKLFQDRKFYKTIAFILSLLIFQIGIESEVLTTKYNSQLKSVVEKFNKKQYKEVITSTAEGQWEKFLRSKRRNFPKSGWLRLMLAHPLSLIL